MTNESPRGRAGRTTDKPAAAVLTAKQAPHRPGTAPALGLRAGRDGLVIVSQTASRTGDTRYGVQLFVCIAKTECRPRAEDVPETFYRQVRADTRKPRRPNRPQHPD